MKKFLYLIAFAIIVIVTGCDALKSDSNDGDDGRGGTEGESQSMLIMPDQIRPV